MATETTKEYSRCHAFPQVFYACRCFFFLLQSVFPPLSPRSFLSPHFFFSYIRFFFLRLFLQQLNSHEWRMELAYELVSCELSSHILFGVSVVWLLRLLFFFVVLYQNCAVQGSESHLVFTFGLDVTERFESLSQSLLSSHESHGSLLLSRRKREENKKHIEQSVKERQKVCVSLGLICLSKG